MTRGLRRGLHAGFTLLEMLVTLLIVSLVAAIVWQAMGQLARIEGLLEQGQMQGLAQTVRGEWVRSALASLMPGTPDSAERFQGSATELSGLSADVPRWPAPGLAVLHLRLVRDAEGRSTVLQLVDDAADGSTTGPVVTPLLSWAGSEGRFLFEDDQGQWQDQWPPLSLKKAPPLPRAVLLQTGLPEMRLLVAAPVTSEVQMPGRRQLEGL